MLVKADTGALAANIASHIKLLFCEFTHSLPTALLGWTNIFNDHNRRALKNYIKLI